jgi:hypothetical protein
MCDWVMTEPWNFGVVDANECEALGVFKIKRKENMDLELCADHLPWSLFVYGPHEVHLETKHIDWAKGTFENG